MTVIASNDGHFDLCGLRSPRKFLSPQFLSPPFIFIIIFLIFKFKTLMGFF
jgi:hypothetical protein